MDKMGFYLYAFNFFLYFVSKAILTTRLSTFLSKNGSIDNWLTVAYPLCKGG